MPAKPVMDKLRSIVFNLLYVFGSLFWSLVLLWTFVLPPRRCTAMIARFYAGYITLIEKYVMGIRLELRGLENLPADTPYIIAAKHQSAYETLKLPFMEKLDYPVIVLKKELTRLPVWGLYPKRMGLIAIDRSAGMESMRAMIAGCRAAMDTKRNVIIFPQGTRVAPGAVEDYKPGLAKIYKDLNVPIVPMALNTGVYWARNAFFKKSGTIVFEFLPPLPAGEAPLQTMKTLEERLEAASDRLVQEAGGPALGTIAPRAKKRK
ncbi:MAG: lysophospholipid acyltransferase family protein [Bdellovibrionales bacterium]|nr:lysophospholipid acyltransferase family protein [Bdellovibrionales bacterium]